MWWGMGIRKRLFTTTSSQVKFQSALVKQQSLSSISKSILHAKQEDFTKSLCALSLFRVGEYCKDYSVPPPERRVLAKVLSVFPTTTNDTLSSQETVQLVQGIAWSGWEVDKEVDDFLLSSCTDKTLSQCSPQQLLDILHALSEMHISKGQPNEELHFRVLFALTQLPDLSALSTQDVWFLTCILFPLDSTMLTKLEKEFATRMKDASLSALELVQLFNTLVGKGVPISFMEDFVTLLMDRDLEEVPIPHLLVFLTLLERLHVVGTYPFLTKRVVNQLAERGGAPVFLGWKVGKQYVRLWMRIHQDRKNFTEEGRSVLEGERITNLHRLVTIVGIASFFTLFVQGRVF